MFEQLGRVFSHNGGGADVRGRNRHTPFPLPMYEYQQGLTKEAKLQMGEAKSNIMQSQAMAMAASGSTSQHPAVRAPAVGGSDTGGEEVDNTTAAGHFARTGEAGPSHLGADAGQQLGTRTVMGGGMMED